MQIVDAGTPEATGERPEVPEVLRKDEQLHFFGAHASTTEEVGGCFERDAVDRAFHPSCSGWNPGSKLPVTSGLELKASAAEEVHAMVSEGKGKEVLVQGSKDKDFPARKFLVEDSAVKDPTGGSVTAKHITAGNGTEQEVGAEQMGQFSVFGDLDTWETAADSKRMAASASPSLFSEDCLAGAFTVNKTTGKRALEEDPAVPVPDKMTASESYPVARFPNIVGTSILDTAALDSNILEPIGKNPEVVAVAMEDGSADGNTCAICLNQIPASDLSIIKDCEHVYCVYCILRWATFKDTPWCPQCKKPFTYLYCHRQLDGTLSDFAIEESVTLLKRATWFEEHVKIEEKGKPLVAEDAAPASAPGSQDWYQEFYEDFDEGNEDEEIEDFYFSRAAGHARIVIANRRWGENGYMRSGRMFATPSSGPSSHGKAKARGAGKSGKAQLSHPYGSSPPSSSFLSSSPDARTVGSSPSGSNPGSASKPGRRAKRNAKRNAADVSGDPYM